MVSVFWPSFVDSVGVNRRVCTLAQYFYRYTFLYLIIPRKSSCDAWFFVSTQIFFPFVLCLIPPFFNSLLPLHSTAYNTINKYTNTHTLTCLLYSLLYKYLFGLENRMCVCSCILWKYIHLSLFFFLIRE